MWQTECTCRATSEPLAFVQFVHYISSSALVWVIQLVSWLILLVPRRRWLVPLVSWLIFLVSWKLPTYAASVWTYLSSAVLCCQCGHMHSFPRPLGYIEARHIIWAVACFLNVLITSLIVNALASSRWRGHYKKRPWQTLSGTALHASTLCDQSS